MIDLWSYAFVEAIKIMLLGGIVYFLSKIADNLFKIFRAL